MSQIERSGTLDNRSFSDDPMAIFEIAKRADSSAVPGEPLAGGALADWVRDVCEIVTIATAMTDVLDAPNSHSGDAIRVPIAGRSYLVTQRDGKDGFREFTVRQEDLQAPGSFTARFEVDSHNIENIAAATFSAVVLDPQMRARHREVVVGNFNNHLNLKYFFDGLAQKDAPRQYREREEAVI